MRRPGTRLRAIAARLCDARTMERLVDPTVSDLQTEYADAVTRGRRWESARIWIVGHIALVHALFAVACTSRRRWHRMVPLLAGVLVIAAYYAFMLWALGAGRDDQLSPFAAAWAPNAALLLLTFVIVGLNAVRANDAAQA